MTTVNKTEVDNAQGLSKVLLMIATSNSPHVGMTGLITATAVAAASLGFPLENITALFDKTAAEVYATNEKMKGGLN